MKYPSIFLLLLFTNTFAFGQTILRYHLAKGDSFTVQQDAHQSITQDAEGMTHVITNDLQGIIRFEVEGIKEDIYELQVSFKDLKLKVNSSLQGDLLVVDALEHQEDDQQSKMFHGLLNIPVTVFMSSQGEILEVRGGDQLVAKMVEASKMQDPDGIKFLENSLSKEFGSKALSESYEQLTYLYPKKPLSQGDLWENEFHGKLKAKNNWVLEEINKDSLQIAGTSTIRMLVEDENSSMRLEGTQKSIVNASTKSGFIKKMHVEGNASGIAFVGANSETEIPTQIQSTIIYQLIEN